jgi:hypothetical protein
LRLEIGLGNATAVKRLEIDWPGSRTRQTNAVPRMDAAYTAIEGDPELRPIELKRFEFSRTPADVHHHLKVAPAAK